MHIDCGLDIDIFDRASTQAYTNNLKYRRYRYVTGKKI